MICKLVSIIFYIVIAKLLVALDPCLIYDVSSDEGMAAGSGTSLHCWVRVVLDTGCLGYESSWVRVVLGTSFPGYELSWVRVFLGTNCLGYELSIIPENPVTDFLTSHLDPHPSLLKTYLNLLKRHLWHITLTGRLYQADLTPGNALQTIPLILWPAATGW